MNGWIMFNCAGKDGNITRFALPVSTIISLVEYVDVNESRSTGIQFTQNSMVIALEGLDEIMQKIKEA